MKEKIGLFFGKIGSFFKTTFTWSNIKTWPKWLWDKFCNFIQWRFAPSVVALFFGLHVFSQHNLLWGALIFFIGVWFVIQEANK